MKFMIPLIVLDICVAAIGVAAAFNGDTLTSFLLGAGLLFVNFIPFCILAFNGMLSAILESEESFHRE